MKPERQLVDVVGSVIEHAMVQWEKWIWHVEIPTLL
jgi:hypothetical protein